jgi:hypothetical protein
MPRKPEALELAKSVNEVVGRILRVHEGPLKDSSDPAEAAYVRGRKEAAYRIAEELLVLIAPFKVRSKPNLRRIK